MRTSFATVAMLAALGAACSDDEENVQAPIDAGTADMGVDAPDLGTPDSGEPDVGPGPAAVTFVHGVASGDPLADRVVIWTRATPVNVANVELDIRWEVATDESFNSIVQQGMVTTSTSSDLTVKVDVAGLSPATTYYYRFVGADGTRSPRGRTKTLPLGPVANIRFAVVSCSHYSAGYFNVYRMIADRSMPGNDLDAVLHLGDYFYEYGDGEYADNDIPGRTPIPPTEVFTLADYRARHAQYKSDPDLQTMHATHPMIAVWDDHESANNAWTDGAENHQPAQEGPWSVREAAAIQAYYEWMPIRTPAMGGSIYRRFQFGELATLHMIDTRLEGRELQLDYADFARDQQSFLQQFLNPQRTLLGSVQEQWLNDGLTQATTTWQVIGNQVQMAQLYNPVLPNPTNSSTIAAANLIAQAGEQLAMAGVVPGTGLPFSLDAWDGYVVARERLFQTFGQVRNVVVLTGDFHNSWASELARDADLRQGGAYDPQTGAGTVGVEFVTTSVTSPGFEGVLDEALLDPIRLFIQQKNTHIKYVDLRRRGFLELTLTATAARAQFVFTQSIATATAAEVAGPLFLVPEGQKRLQRQN